MCDCNSHGNCCVICVLHLFSDNRQHRLGCHRCHRRRHRHRMMIIVFIFSENELQSIWQQLSEHVYAFGEFVSFIRFPFNWFSASHNAFLRCAMPCNRASNIFFWRFVFVFSFNFSITKKNFELAGRRRWGEREIVVMKKSKWALAQLHKTFEVRLLWAKGPRVNIAWASSSVRPVVEHDVVCAQILIARRRRQLDAGSAGICENVCGICFAQIDIYIIFSFSKNVYLRCALLLHIDWHLFSVSSI